MKKPQILIDFIDSAKDSYHVLNENLEILEINKAAFIALDEASDEINCKEDIIGKKLEEIYPFIKDRIPNFKKVIETGERYIYEETVPHPQRGDLCLRVESFKVGEGLGIIAEDITERKKAEEQIQKDLKEKDILLKEIHHRVKNNLQIICSLLNLQAHNVKDKEVLSMFEESRNRVYSMALVHEGLYRGKDYTEVDFGCYIDNLVSNLKLDYSRIKYKSNIVDITLEIDLAIPCGLIVNELFTNVIKHAFPPSFQGRREASITLHKFDDEIIEFIVEDNGVGLPEAIDFRTTESLGLKLVYLLAEEQLGGEIKIDRTNGTRISIRIKRN